MQKAAKSTADDVKKALPEAKSAARDAQKAAKSTADDVKEAADSASKEAGQTINAATDTVDLVSRCCSLCVVPPDGPSASFGSMVYQAGMPACSSSTLKCTDCKQGG